MAGWEGNVEGVRSCGRGGVVISGSCKLLHCLVCSYLPLHMRILKHVYVEANTVILMKTFLSKYLKFLFSKSKLPSREYNFLIVTEIIILEAKETLHSY